MKMVDQTVLFSRMALEIIREPNPFLTFYPLSLLHDPSFFFYSSSEPHTLAKTLAHFTEVAPAPTLPLRNRLCVGRSPQESGNRLRLVSHDDRDRRDTVLDLDRDGIRRRVVDDGVEVDLVLL